MSASSSGHVPSGPWEFDQSVTDCFDDMLQRSIPNYLGMRSACALVADGYVVPGSTVLDIGCSRGEVIAEMQGRWSRSMDVKYRGLEVSKPMLDAARERFANDDSVRIQDVDLRASFSYSNVSVAFAVLTLQFTPIEHRARIVYDIYNSLRPGGAMILVEKVLGETAGMHGMMDSIYLDFKRRSGYTEEEIARKKLSLEGRLVSVTANANEALLKAGGFSDVECFWRWMNFAAWVAVK